MTLQHRHSCHPVSCYLPSGETLLTACVLQESIFLLKAYLTEPNLDPNHPNKDGNPPLLLAVQLENIELVILLLADSRIDVDRLGKYEISPLQLSIAKGLRNIAEKLLQRGADPQGQIQNGVHDVIREQQVEKTPLHLAVHDADMMTMFLKYAGTVKVGFVILQALNKSRFDVVRVLLTAANKDADDFEDYSQDILSAAASYHNCDIVQQLVNLSISCNKTKFTVKSHYKTYKDFVFAAPLGPMPYIIHFGCMNCFHYVLPHIKDLNIPDNFGNTLIEYALLSTHWRCKDPFDEASTKHVACTQIKLSQSRYGGLIQLSPIRLYYVEELLKKGVSAKCFWEKNFHMFQYTSSNFQEEMKVIHFLLQVHHSVKDHRVHSLSKNLRLQGDFTSLVLLYLDGYIHTENISTRINNPPNQIERNMKSNHPRINQNNFHLLSRNPRSLKGVAVLSVRKAIASDIFFNVRLLPLPEYLRQLILLRAPDCLLPENF